MSTAELAYLLLCICAMALFAATLGWVDWYTHRAAEKTPAQLAAKDQLRKVAG
jgi:hypothetical protein